MGPILVSVFVDRPAIAKSGVSRSRYGRREIHLLADLLVRWWYLDRFAEDVFLIQQGM